MNADERRLNAVLIENHFHTKLLHSNYKNHGAIVFHGHPLI